MPFAVAAAVVATFTAASTVATVGFTVVAALEVTAAVGATVAAVGALTHDKTLQLAGTALGIVGGIGALATSAGLFGAEAASGASLFGTGTAASVASDATNFGTGGAVTAGNFTADAAGSAGSSLSAGEDVVNFGSAGDILDHISGVVTSPGTEQVLSSTNSINPLGATQAASRSPDVSPAGASSAAPDPTNPAPTPLASADRVTLSPQGGAAADGVQGPPAPAAPVSGSPQGTVAGIDGTNPGAPAGVDSTDPSFANLHQQTSLVPGAGGQGDSNVAAVPDPNPAVGATNTTANVRPPVGQAQAGLISGQQAANAATNFGTGGAVDVGKLTADPDVWSKLWDMAQTKGTLQATANLYNTQASAIAAQQARMNQPIPVATRVARDVTGTPAGLINTPPKTTVTGHS